MFVWFSWLETYSQPVMSTLFLHSKDYTLRIGGKTHVV